jgi:hypothetical protein
MAFDPTQLGAAFEAQVARDETMAERLAQFLASPAGRDRTALVVCGRGHCEYGLGTPARVSRRVPGIGQRIVLLSESGDLRLSEQERQQSRQIEVSHEFLRELGRSLGVYFHLTSLKGAEGGLSGFQVVRSPCARLPDKPDDPMRYSNSTSPWPSPQGEGEPDLTT